MLETNQIYLGDCYELIKQIPDKSIDLVYTDIPYLFDGHGAGSSELSTRLTNRETELMTATNRYELAKDKPNSEALRIARNVVKSSINTISIVDGIDYKIFDELCRVMKHIYIYIYGVLKTKWSIY